MASEIRTDNRRRVYIRVRLQKINDELMAHRSGLENFFALAKMGLRSKGISFLSSASPNLPKSGSG